MIHAYVHKHACALTPMNEFYFHPILFYSKSMMTSLQNLNCIICVYMDESSV